MYIGSYNFLFYISENVQIKPIDLLTSLDILEITDGSSRCRRSANNSHCFCKPLHIVVVANGVDYCAAQSRSTIASHKCCPERRTNYAGYPHKSCPECSDFGEGLTLCFVQRHGFVSEG